MPIKTGSDKDDHEFSVVDGLLHTCNSDFNQGKLVSRFTEVCTKRFRSKLEISRLNRIIQQADWKKYMREGGGGDCKTAANTNYISRRRDYDYVKVNLLIIFKLTLLYSICDTPVSC